MGEGGPEEAPVQVDVPAPRGQVPVRHVGLLAPRAVDLDPARPWLVRHAQGQQLLPVAVEARAVAVDGLLEFLVDLGEATRRLKESLVDAPVEVEGVLIKVDELLYLELVLARDSS